MKDAKPPVTESLENKSQDKNSQDNHASEMLTGAEDVLASVKQQLDEAEQSLSAEDLRSLRLARANAIETLNRRKFYWRPVAAVATAASVVAIVIGLQGIQTASFDPSYEVGAHSVEDLPLLSASEELECYEELEFYQWLELEDRAS